MKKILYRFFMVVLLVPFVISCNDAFFTSDPGNVINGDHLEEVGPAAGLNGMYGYMYKMDTMEQGDDDVEHYDYGYMHFVLASELWGQDMVQYSAGYNWYYNEYRIDITTRAYQYLACFYHWNFFYRLVKCANDVLNSFTEEIPEMRGQALAMRAFAYMHLVQLYQFTYKGHENSPGIPLIPETSTTEELSNNPRVTVSRVYQQIEEDLLNAYDDLQGFNRRNITVIDKSVVCGLLARMYLLKEEWGDAEKYAIEARSSYTTLDSKEQLIDEGYVDMDKHPSWMWTSYITIDADIVDSGIVNFISHISSTAYGYVTAGDMFKNISSELYDKIPDTDIRKAWWCSEDMTYQGGPMEEVDLPKYANLKYGWYNLAGNNCNDYCYMRAEEMWLIEIEAKTMGGNPAEAKRSLEEFVKTRQPDYVCEANTPEELRDEIWLQRRIEFWGEGLAFLDLKRLKKPIVRNYEGTNHNDDARRDFPAEDDVFNLVIPRKEIQDNNGISEADNNSTPRL